MKKRNFGSLSVLNTGTTASGCAPGMDVIPGKVSDVMA